MHRSIGIITLGVFILVMWYAAFRLHIHFGTVSFWVYQIVIVAIVFGSFALFSISAKYPTPFVKVINILGGYALLFLAYLSILLVIVQITTLIWSIPVLFAGQIAVGTAFVITLTGAVLGSIFIVRETEITIPKLKNELRIIQISDAHIGLLYGRKYLAKIVRAANSARPDFIVITGDLTETKAALKDGILEPLADFDCPAFFVEGNHDHYTGIEGVLKIIGKQNIRTLHNEVIETHGIQLIGLDYLNPDEETVDMMHLSGKKDTVKSALSKMQLNHDMPTILITHNPTGINYAEAAGVDLMIAGHTHRGQIFPFSIFAKMLFQFFGGLHQHGNMQIFISGGVGGIVARMRLGSFNEINLLRLVP